MKVFILLSTLIGLSIADWAPVSKEKLIQTRNNCAKEIYLSNDLIDKVNKFDFPNDPKVHKLIECSAIKLELFNDKNGFYPDRLAVQIGKNTPEGFNAVSRCLDRNEQGTSVEEWAWRNYRCVLQSGLHAPFKT